METTSEEQTQSEDQTARYDYEEGAYYRYDPRYQSDMFVNESGVPYKKRVRRPSAAEEQANNAWQSQVRSQSDDSSNYTHTTYTDTLSNQMAGMSINKGPNYSYHEGPSAYGTGGTYAHTDPQEEDEEEEEEDDDDDDEGAGAYGVYGAAGEDDSGDEDDTSPGIAYEPKEAITDPELLNKGAQARSKIYGTKGREERLDPSYRVRDDPDRFFVPGRVLKVLWPELAGYRVDNMTIVTSPNTKFKNEKVILKIRWFVVVKSGYKWCTCLPVSTYGRRGLDGKNLPLHEHSMIYTGKRAPPILPGEKPRLRGERGMLSPIHVRGKTSQDVMDPKSRINYAKLYTIEHNVKVREFGKVKSVDIPLLMNQWNDVLTGTISNSQTSSSYGTSAYSAHATTPAEESPASHYPSPTTLHTAQDNQGSSESRYVDFAVARFPHEAAEGSRIQMNAGDRLGVIQPDAGGWTMVYNQRTRQEGYVPSNYIALDSEQDQV